METLEECLQEAEKNLRQSHLCICNTDLFDLTVTNGVYGFPHAGLDPKKSFWRATASMYNVGPGDLLFLYRTKGNEPGSQEICGPFKVFSVDGHPATYYDSNSPDLTMSLPKGGSCRVRLLFEAISDHVYSIADNFELIKRYESREIWGYRHPAVMNIGAARKKSVTSFTSVQTKVILDLFRNYGKQRARIAKKIPAAARVAYYKSLSNPPKNFRLDDAFLVGVAKTNNAFDEAFFYAYINRGLRDPGSVLHKPVIEDFSKINDKMLAGGGGVRFSDYQSVLMEAVITPHLQDELDLVLFNADDSSMLIMEIKEGSVNQQSVDQATKYLDLLRAIFPKKSVFANIVGKGVDSGLNINPSVSGHLRLVKYVKKGGLIRFSS